MNDPYGPDNPDRDPRNYPQGVQGPQDNRLGPQQPPPGWQPQQPLNHAQARAQARGAKAQAKAMRPWFKKKRFILPLALVVFFVIIGIATSGGNNSAPVAGVPAAATPTKAPATEEATEEPTKEPTKKATEEPTKKAIEEPTKEPKSTKKALTDEQQDAVGAAEDYLNFTAFSRDGLIEQLSSDAGSGFSKKDAAIAVDSMDIDYKEQAAKAAKSYRDFSHFSRRGLIEQLESGAGSGFTHKQAVYGADHSR